MSVEVENLMVLMRFRGLLRRYGIVKAAVTPQKTSLTFSPLTLLRDGHKATQNTRVDGLKALQLVQKQPRKFRFGTGNTLAILFEKPEEVSLVDVFKKVNEVLSSVAYRPG
jgi:hypothetical protein